MKLSLNWLADFLPVDSTPKGVEALVHELTMLGFEVESVDRIERRLEGVVCAKIVGIEPHPDAEKLRLVTVDFGEELKLVCGAPNVEVGQMVPLAQIGAKLPGLENKPLKKAKIRGVESLGMLCSDVELGLSDDASGLKVLDPAEEWRPGRLLGDVYGFADVVLDLEITQNRGDALSILGIARDLAALRKVQIKAQPMAHLEPQRPGSSFVVEIDTDCAQVACPRYSALRLSDVKVAASPPWMVNRLEAVGLRSINNVVDVTNYVMWEMGHPLHAFDLREVKGDRIQVRFASEGETFTTLDGEERKLNAKHTLICDGERPVALAGIMGGLNSGIASDTTDLLLEIAAFDSVNIRMGARNAGVSSDSSRRFERGVDQDAVLPVLNRTLQLMGDLAGARQAGPFVDAHPTKRVRPEVLLRTKRTNEILAFNLSSEQIRNDLEALGILCKEADEGLLVQGPTWRFDLDREIDFIEEVVRLEGYEKVQEATMARVPLRARPNPFRDFLPQVRRAIQGLGFSQVMSYSMVDAAGLKSFYPDRPALTIRNPLSEDMAKLRTSLLPSLVQTAIYNLNRRNENLCLFELDREFHPDADSDTGCREEKHLAFLMTGQAEQASWRSKGRPSDFYSLKETLRQLLSALRLESYQLEPYLDECFSANSMAIRVGRDVLGCFGQMNPVLAKELGLGVDLFLCDINLEKLFRYARSTSRYKAFSRFPTMWRDLCFVSDASVTAGEIEKVMMKKGSKLLDELSLFDLYEGERIDDGKISRSWRLGFRSLQASLSDQDVEPLIKAITQAVETAFGAKLRL
jgi:phenylalanyl-tRNA synthetase beta chain